MTTDTFTLKPLDEESIAYFKKFGISRQDADKAFSVVAQFIFDNGLNNMVVCRRGKCLKFYFNQNVEADWRS